jgi:4-amino-4-deoxy-L-arabinose transferase-like glycosyltransferase
MNKRALSILLLVLLSGLIASIIVLSWIPPISKDELVHHLAVPKLYLKHGGMYEIPFMPFSYYPMNLDLLYVIPLYFGNDIVPKFIHFSFALFTAALLFGYLRKRTGVGYALFGVVFFLSTPIIVKLSISAYVDLGVVFFSFASLLLLLKWSESGFKRTFLILAGAMSGLAMGTKYNGMVTTLLLALFAPILYARKGNAGRPGVLKPASQGFIFFVFAFLVFSPWMIRNYHWTKNPVYPLYNHLFNPPAPRQELSAPKGADGEERRGAYGIFAYRRAIYGEKGWQMALLPLRIFFEGKDGSPRHFDGKLNPFILFLSVLAFWRMREAQEEVRKERKVMLAFVVLFFSVAFFTTDLRIRYIGPIIPVLVVLSVMGVENLHRAIAKRGNRTALGLLVIGLTFALAYNGKYVIDQFKEVEPLQYITGKISRDEYLEKHRPEYAALRFVNTYLPQDSKVMMVFVGSRGYYSERSYVHGEEALDSIFLDSNDAQEMRSKLKNMGITHLLIYEPLFGRWVSDNLKERAEGSLKEFLLNYVKLIYSKNGFCVLALGDVSS